MRSIHDIVKLINDPLGTLKDSTIYGIAQSAMRGDDKVPMMAGGEYVGVDDRAGIIIYHKLNNLTSRIDKARGMGRKPFYINIYQLSLYVYLNRKRVTLLNDELFNSVQELFPDVLTLQPYSFINIAINSAILNDTQVWAEEYNADYRLTVQENLFRVNYTVEAGFLKGCFNNC